MFSIARFQIYTFWDWILVYIFGGSVPHLHIHLAPHHSGDALNAAMIWGELASEKQESGVMHIISKEFPPLPVETLSEVAGRIRQRLERVA